MKPSYEYKKFCLVFLMGMLIFFSTGCLKSVEENKVQLQGYPIASDVFTTAQRTVEPGPKPLEKIRLDELSKYFATKYEITPIHIYEDKIILDQEEVSVDVSQDHFRAIHNRNRPCQQNACSRQNDIQEPLQDNHNSQKFIECIEAPKLVSDCRQTRNVSC